MSGVNSHRLEHHRMIFSVTMHSMGDAEVSQLRLKSQVLDRMIHFLIVFLNPDKFCLEEWDDLCSLMMFTSSLNAVSSGG